MRLLLLSTLMICAAAPCNAGWQKTEWGMSIDEVKRVMPDLNLSKINNKAYEAKYSVTLYDGKTTDVDISLSFTQQTEKLYSVSISSTDEHQCDKILTSLRLAYGRSLFSDADIVSDNNYWIDQKNNNQIGFYYEKQTPVVCYVDYTPPVQKNAPGSL